MTIFCFPWDLSSMQWRSTRHKLYSPKELVMPYKCDEYCNEKNSISISYNKKNYSHLQNHFNVIKLKNCRANDTSISSVNVQQDTSKFFQVTCMQMLLTFGPNHHFRKTIADIRKLLLRIRIKFAMRKSNSPLGIFFKIYSFNNSVVFIF